MQSLANLTARIAELEARLENILQLAKVTAVDAQDNLLDLEVRGEPLKAVPYLTTRAGDLGKTYWVPEVDEVGMLLCPAGDVGNAIFMPALNYNDRPAPETDEKVATRIFKKDDVIEKVDGNIDEHTFKIGSSKRTMNRTKVKLEQTGLRFLEINENEAILQNGSSTIKITPTMIELTAGGTTVRLVAGVATVHGARFFGGPTSLRAIDHAGPHPVIY